MKAWKIALIIAMIFILSIPTYFVYTRLFLDRFEMRGNILIVEDNIYVLRNTFTVSDEEGLGKTLGIAIEGKRTVIDFIFPFWVIEYKDDKDHNRIFVRGLMGSGGVYDKTSK